MQAIILRRDGLHRPICDTIHWFYFKLQTNVDVNNPGQASNFQSAGIYIYMSVFKILQYFMLFLFSAVDGNWGEWSTWNTCSKTCKQGTQSRTRKCDSPAPLYGGKSCEGNSSQAQVCNKDIPCPG